MAKLVKKCRLCRREGVKLFLKGERCFSAKCPLEKRGAVPPGMHGVKSGMRLSQYGQQLREKQKAKRMYGLSERQFRRYFDQAFKARGRTGEALLQLIERRLDNVVYRLGLAPSRATARQLIVHGFVRVNDKKVTIPSYQVVPGEEIRLTEKALKMEKVKKWAEKKEGELPSWLKRKGFIGKVTSLPAADDLPQEINTQLIVEFYSR